MKHSPQVGDIWKYTDSQSLNNEVFYLLILEIAINSEHQYLCIDMQRDIKNVWSFHDCYYDMWEFLA